MALSPHPAYALFAATVYMLAYMLGGLPFQQLQVLLACRDIERIGNITIATVDYTSCAQRADVQALVASWAVWFHLAQEIPALAVLVVAGYFVDIFGRRRAMAVACASLVVNSCAYLCAALFFETVPLSLYVLSYFLSGLTGGISLTFLAVSAYIADTTEASERTKYFMMMDGAMAIAMSLGPFFGGFITKNFGFASVFAAELVLGFILLLFLLFVFPDSEPNSAVERSHKSLPVVFSESIASSTLTMRQVFKFGTATALIAIVTLQGFAQSGAQIMFLLYPAKRFGWAAYDIGQFIFTLSVQRIIWLSLLLPSLLSFAKSRGVNKISCEVWALRFGLLMACTSELGYGLAVTERQFIMNTIPAAVSSFAAPTIRSILSTLVPPSHQGRLFSSIRLFEAVSLLFATVVVNFIYRSTVEFMPQAIFFIMSSVLGLGFLISVLFVTNQGVAEMHLGGVTEIVAVGPERNQSVVEDETTALLS
ncbi:major facilitator superfamily domain-containing protein [Obelidium mucronatum]|nr:major facilitator superfamily domain-containing protein [Obelidium mucronatum]